MVSKECTGRSLAKGRHVKHERKGQKGGQLPAGRSPAVVALSDGSRVLVAQRQEVEELPHVEQGFDVVFESMVRHS